MKLDEPFPIAPISLDRTAHGGALWFILGNIYH